MLPFKGVHSVEITTYLYQEGPIPTVPDSETFLAILGCRSLSRNDLQRE